MYPNLLRCVKKWGPEPAIGQPPTEWLHMNSTEAAGQVFSKVRAASEVRQPNCQSGRPRVVP